MSQETLRQRLIGGPGPGCTGQTLCNGFPGNISIGRLCWVDVEEIRGGCDDVVGRDGG